MSGAHPSSAPNTRSALNEEKTAIMSDDVLRSRTSNASVVVVFAVERPFSIIGGERRQRWHSTDSSATDGLAIH